MSRVWTEDEIKILIQTNDKVLYGALKGFMQNRLRTNSQQVKHITIMAQVLMAQIQDFCPVFLNFF